MAKDRESNVAANDRTLTNGAKDPSYMYSVNDVHNIAIALRKKYLNYDGKEEILDGNDYNALRENNNNLLLLDPCNVQNIENHIFDEITKLIEGGQGVKTWQYMPRTIIIPFLTAGHWISMKVDIDIDLDADGNNHRASLLWDNPYGLSYELGEYTVNDKQITSLDIIGYVRSSIERLMKRYLPNQDFKLRDGESGNWILNYQQMDQQGIDVDGVSCGTVTMQNIEDYLDARVNHGKGVPTEYTIPSYKDNVAVNRAQIKAAKNEHIEMYASVTGEDIPEKVDATLDPESSSLTEDDLFLDDEDRKKLEEEIAEFEKNLFTQWNLDKDLKLPDAEEEKAKTITEIKRAHEKALGYFEGERLQDISQIEAAAAELVKVMRPTLSKPLMKNLYVNTEDVLHETLSAMYHLGLIYLQDNRGEQGYFNNHAKAAAIFQYCAEFSDKYKAVIKLPNDIIGDYQYFTGKSYLVEKQFLENLNSLSKGSEGEGKEEDNGSLSEAEYIDANSEKSNGYKDELFAIREDIKDQLEEIKDITVDEIGKRADAVEKIYQQCNSFFVNKDGTGLVQRLLEDCYKQLNNYYKQLGKLIPEKDEYAVIGLGSLSTGTITPWSDLEFAILVNESENKEACKEYFRDLTKLLHIKIINLGETHLKSMGVESLNDFKTGEEKDEWFWDDVMKIKFNFDSTRWNACKDPLGRKGNHVVKEKIKYAKIGSEKEIIKIKPDYELIRTPEEMADFQKEEVPELEAFGVKNWFESDKHLVQALRTVSLIDGNQKLIDQYRAKLQEVENAKILQARALQILREDVNKFSLKIGDEEEGKLIDTKQDIYRLGDRIITGLANYYNISDAELPEGSKKIQTIGVWNNLIQMEELEKLSKEGAQHLKEAVAIATELRLRNYSNNDAREESMSTYVPVVEHLSETERKKLLQETLHFQNTDILKHFYYVMLRLQEIIQVFCDNKYDKAGQGLGLLENENLFDDSDYNKGMVHARFLEYKKAIKFLEIAREKQPENSNILQRLFCLYMNASILDRIITIAKEIFELNKDDINNYLMIVQCNINLGNAYTVKGKHNQAIKHLKEALKILADKNSHIDLKSAGIIHSNLGNIYFHKGDYNQAIANYKKALEIKSLTYDNLNNLSIATTKQNLGLTYSQKSEYNKAIKHLKEALKIRLSGYKDRPNHPSVATSFHNLGEVYASKGEDNKAIKYLQKALKILQLVFSSITSIVVADIHKDLGKIYGSKMEYNQAIKHSQKALEITQAFYNSHPNHPDIAIIREQLVLVYQSKSMTLLAKGEFDQAIEYLQKSLKISQVESPSYTDIVDIYEKLGLMYNKKGITCMEKGEYDQAIENLQKALKALQIIHRNHPNHLDIAINYNNLGSVYASKGEYDQAIANYQKALEIKLLVSVSILSIIDTYKSLEAVYTLKGEYDQAKKHSNYAKVIFQIDPARIRYEGEKYTVNLKDTQEFTVSLENIALKAIVEKRFDDALKFYAKIFQIYDLVLTDNPEQFKLVKSYFATVLFLTNNIEDYITLKFKTGVELNKDLIKLSGQNVNNILVKEKIIVQTHMQQNALHEIMVQNSHEGNIVVSGDINKLTDDDTREH